MTTIMTDSFFSVIRGGLPEGFDFNELASCGKPEWWTLRPEMALAYALRKSSKLDWSGYVDKYQEVARSGIEPVWHFIRKGAFEGKKVPPKKLPPASIEIFSAIISPFRDEAFLERTLSSLVAQKGITIEIIALSPDKAYTRATVFQNLVDSGHNIKFVETGGLGRHQSRIAALEHATGSLCAFIAPPSVLSPDACAKYLAAGKRGYDLMKIGFNLSSANPSHRGELGRINTRCNCKSDFERSGSEIWTSLKQETCVYPELGLFAIRTELAREAFKLIAPDVGDEEADYLEIEALAKTARSFLRIAERLSTHVFTAPDLPSRVIGLFAGSFPDIKWQTARTVGAYRQEIRHANLIDKAKIWLASTAPENVTHAFNQMAEEYGLLPTIQAIYDLCPNGWEQVASQFQHYEPGVSPHPVKTIGFVYTQMLNGGIESAIIDLTRILLDSGYKVKIFLRQSRAREAEIDARAEIIHMPKPDPKSLDAVYVDSLRPLETHAKEIDIMILQDPWSWDILWKTMVLKYKKVSVFLIHHFDFYLPLLYPEKKYNLQANFAVFRCLDKLICQTRVSELYFRNLGINAQYLFNPIKNISTDIAESSAEMNNVTVVCRLAAPVKQTRQSLLVLSELVKLMPDAKMTFVGFFGDDKFEQEFYAFAEELGIKKHIVFTGWTNDPDRHMLASGCLLSTSYGEGFPLAISEAQAKGRPVVMYYLPIAAAENNESIISVPQGDYKKAAREIAALLSDRPRWRRLANIALEKCRQYSPDKYMTEFGQMIQTYRSYSKFNPYTTEDYQEAIRTLSFYSASLPPWQRKN